MCSTRFGTWRQPPSTSGSGTGWGCCPVGCPLGDVEPERPFFIEYDHDRQHRAEGWRGSLDRAGHDHRVGGFSFLEVAGDRAGLSEA